MTYVYYTQRNINSELSPSFSNIGANHGPQLQDNRQPAPPLQGGLAQPGPQHDEPQPLQKEPPQPLQKEQQQHQSPIIQGLKS